MLFDHPAPLPVAKVHAHRVASFASRVRGAREDGWRWFRPRAVPAIVAVVGMLAVLGATEYLTRLARETPLQTVPTAIMPSEQIAEAPTPIEPPTRTTLVITHGEPVITVDSKPVPAVVLDVPPSNCQIHLER